MNIKKVGPYIIVKSGVHCEDGTEVAIKVIQKSKLSEETDLLQKFRKEMTLQRIFSHPNVIKTRRVIETETHLFLVLEKLSKGELFDYIVENDYLPSDQARKIFRQIIFGLEYIHSFCIAHRDLKPENILLDENLNVKIADFGMAHINEMNTLLKTACGSPHYVAPEILKRKIQWFGNRYLELWCNFVCTIDGHFTI
ncbi:protein kinase [Anaeramoeba flamelloides]|uniref:Protein kinase n=1 Tax=Anaeramoeba flamelloides TaxID=1746091 RepID=A0AAV7YU18_9EUKA|nr:protein kinase [Anaeramoeba flamelloides]